MALDRPAEIVTELGNEAFGLLLPSPMVSPSVPTTPLIKIDPVDEPGPATRDGFNLTDTTAGGFIERVACREAPFHVAVIVEFVWSGTPTVVMANVDET